MFAFGFMWSYPEVVLAGVYRKKAFSSMGEGVFLRRNVKRFVVMKTADSIQTYSHLTVHLYQ